MITAISSENWHKYFFCISGTNCSFDKCFVQLILWSVVLVSTFYLAGAPEVGISDDWDNASIIHRERDSYRTNVLHVREINFLLQQIETN